MQKYLRDPFKEKTKLSQKRVTSFSKKHYARRVDVGRVDVEEVISEVGRADEAGRQVAVDVEELGVDGRRRDGRQVGVGREAEVAEADGAAVGNLQIRGAIFRI